MSDVVNLRLARKARHRADAASKADERRRQFGRSRAERVATGQERELSERLLDGAYRAGRTPDTQGD